MTPQLIIQFCGHRNDLIRMLIHLSYRPGSAYGSNLEFLLLTAYEIKLNFFKRIYINNAVQNAKTLSFFFHQKFQIFIIVYALLPYNKLCGLFIKKSKKENFEVFSISQSLWLRSGSRSSHSMNTVPTEQMLIRIRNSVKTLRASV